jgi:hypothetical protein
VNCLKLLEQLSSIEKKITYYKDLIKNFELYGKDFNEQCDDDLEKIILELINKKIV